MATLDSSYAQPDCDLRSAGPYAQSLRKDGCPDQEHRDEEDETRLLVGGPYSDQNPRQAKCRVHRSDNGGRPTGSWLEVKGLALPEFLIEIELEAHKSDFD